MGLPDLVKRVISGPVTSIAGPFRAWTTITPMTGRGTKGPIYGTPFRKKALVEEVSQTVTSQDGTEKISTSHFTYFEQFTLNEGDRITLNGIQTNVIKVGGLLDPDGKPYLPEAWTGK